MKIRTEIEIERPEGYPILEVILIATGACPEVLYLRNGDPIQIEVISSKLVAGDGLHPTPEQVRDWADQWLADNYDEALKIVVGEGYKIKKRTGEKGDRK